MQTQSAIVTRLNERKSAPLDFFPEVVIGFLTFNQAKPFLNFKTTSEEEVREKWAADALMEETVLAEMKEYMAFAWGKAQDHRGISANRSVQKMEAWAWLLERDDEIDWENYSQYGAPILKQVCEVFDFPIPEDEDLQRMMTGEQCSPDGCEMGCG